MEGQSIETVDEFRDKLVDPSQRSTLHAALRDVGPKTLDYFDILAGMPPRVAIDSRIRAETSAAGIKNASYTYLAAVIRAAAKTKGWRVGDLDAALWEEYPHSNKHWIGHAVPLLPKTRRSGAT